MNHLCVFFFRPDQRPLQRLVRKAALSTPAGVSRPCTAVCGGWRRQGPGQSCFLATIISSPGAFIPRSLYLRPWPEVLFRRLWGDLTCSRRRKNPQVTFLHSDSVPSTFSLLALPPSPPIDPRVHRTAKAFCLGLPQQ